MEKDKEKLKKLKKARIRKQLNELKKHRCRYLIAVIENPKDIKNIGTIIRNVNALGVSKVYIVDPKKKLSNDWHKIREDDILKKVSVSAIKWSFVKRFDSTQDCLDHLEKRGYISVVTSPHIKGGNNVILHEGDYTTYPKLAVWFGNESRGISDIAVGGSDLCINLPMFGIIESLNLGTSSGIVLYEVTRQRRGYQKKYKHKKKRGKIILHPSK
jgi:tRNA (guanosine-2'-O-)-methyltransferase